MRDPTQRFSDRVENYAKYRPGYPTELYGYLREESGLRGSSNVADLGSGTGLLSQLFLERGHRVYAVEPNDEMRSAAEAHFLENENFISLKGRAEAIPLSNQSVDFLVAGQAFHWFEPVAAKSEMRRVLVPGGEAALIWNRRDTEHSHFQRAYEQLLEQFGTDYMQVDQQRAVSDEKMAAFFTPQLMKKASFPNRQILNAEGLRGRLLSSSYVPLPDDRNYASMLAALDELFAKFQQNGQIHFDYLTTVYHAPIH